jgi:hypothetical protein
LLLAHGANPLAALSDGSTALDMAEDCSSPLDFSTAQERSDCVDMIHSAMEAMALTRSANIAMGDKPKGPKSL